MVCRAYIYIYIYDILSGHLIDRLPGNYSFPLFGLAIELITSASARAFVGPELCRDPEWLATATGYTIE